MLRQRLANKFLDQGRFSTSCFSGHKKHAALSTQTALQFFTELQQFFFPGKEMSQSLPWFILGQVVRYVPTLEPLGDFTFARYAVTIVVLTVALVIVHSFLPAGRRSFSAIAPGIAATLVLWLFGGAIFGRYLSSYAFAYVSMYAGLASAMVALIFLYVCASIFIYGGELNSVIAKERKIPLNKT